MDALHDVPKHSDLIYDVGMHRGEDSAFYLLKGFRVVGFEADPKLAQHCRERFAEQLARGQLTIVEGAIIGPDSPQAGQKKIRFYANENSVWGTVADDWAERNATLGAGSKIIEVDVVDFERIVLQHGVPHYIKIDIEGLDIVCVKAFAKFRARPDYISIESDKTSFTGLQREIETFTALGYDAFQCVEQSAIPADQVPPNPPREGSYVAQRFEEGCSGLFGAELPGTWLSKEETLRRYRWIRRGYYLVGDAGIFRKKFPGAKLLRSLASRFVGLFTRAAVPGWYDTHARHSSARVEKN